MKKFQKCFWISAWHRMVANVHVKGSSNAPFLFLQMQVLFSPVRFGSYTNHLP